jgi:DNA primase
MGVPQAPRLHPGTVPAHRDAHRRDNREWIWITEGEKDADTLTTLGRLATTNAQGAANFPDQLVAQFQGLKVAIVTDRDLAGYQRAINLYGVGLVTRMFCHP